MFQEGTRLWTAILAPARGQVNANEALGRSGWQMQHYVLLVTLLPWAKCLKLGRGRGGKRNTTYILLHCRSVSSCSLRKIHPPQEVLEAGVGAEGVGNSNIKTRLILGVRSRSLWTHCRLILSKSLAKGTRRKGCDCQFKDGLPRYFQPLRFSSPLFTGDSTGCVNSKPKTLARSK